MPRPAAAAANSSAAAAATTASAIAEPSSAPSTSASASSAAAMELLQLSSWERANPICRGELWEAEAARLRQLAEEALCAADAGDVGGREADTKLLHFVGPRFGDGFVPAVLLGALVALPPACSYSWFLTFEQSDITEAGLKLLVSSLAKTPVRSLAILETDIGDEGASHVASALCQGNANLHTLTLRAALLGDAAAVSLATVLISSECNLRSLTLSDNNIGPAGTKALSNALRLGKCRLEQLCLHENTIGDVGAVALAAVIRTQEVSCLLDLDVSNNEIRAVGGMALTSAVQATHCSLRSLCLSGNCVGDREMFKVIQRAQECNRWKPWRRLLGARQRMLVGSMIAHLTGTSNWLLRDRAGKVSLDGLREPELLFVVGELVPSLASEEVLSRTTS
jgi:hypothetical protein